MLLLHACITQCKYIFAAVLPFFKLQSHNFGHSVTFHINFAITGKDSAVHRCNWLWSRTTWTRWYNYCLWHWSWVTTWEGFRWEDHLCQSSMDSSEKHCHWLKLQSKVLRELLWSILWQILWASWGREHMWWKWKCHQSEWHNQYVCAIVG